MNGLLWLGAACTGLLLLAVVVDGIDDAIDLGPDWLSLPVLLAFLGAFGWIAGASVDRLGPLGLALGVAGGLGVGFGTVRLSRGLMDMPTDPTEVAADLLGSIGRVVESPRPGRYGAVLVARPTGPVKVAAIAAAPVAVGTEVVVVDVSSSTLVTVEPLDLDGPSAS